VEPIARTDPVARLRVRARLTPPAMRALARGMRWPAIVLSTALAMVIVTFMKNSGDGYDLLTATRLTIVFIAAGAAMLVDDPATSLTGHSPSPLSFRRVLRLAFGAGVIVISWLASVWYLAGTPRALWGGSVDGFDFPMLRFSTELVAFVLATIAIAIVAGRVAGEDRGGVAGAPGLLAIIMLLARLPGRWAMLTTPGGERWIDSGRDWTAAACALLALVMLLSLDPARRRLRVRRALV